MRIFHSNITNVGEFANDALAENMMILFKDHTSTELERYCFSHQPNQLINLIQVGDYLTIGEQCFLITAVGDVANKNLAELGHIVFVFDAATKATLPGNMHLKGTIPTSINKNTTLLITRT